MIEAAKQQIAKSKEMAEAEKVKIIEEAKSKASGNTSHSSDQNCRSLLSACK